MAATKKKAKPETDATRAKAVDAAIKELDKHRTAMQEANRKVVTATMTAIRSLLGKTAMSGHRVDDIVYYVEDQMTECLSNDCDDNCNGW